jgi:hypothetical protein
LSPRRFNEKGLSAERGSKGEKDDKVLCALALISSSFEEDYRHFGIIAN